MCKTPKPAELRSSKEQLQRYARTYDGMELHEYGAWVSWRQHSDKIESLQRNLDLRNEQIDGYERQLGIIDKGAEHTIGSEIERLQETVKAAQIHTADLCTGHEPATARNEKGWLIEMSFDGTAHWWYGSNFVADANQGVRFAREFDAQQVIMERGLIDAVATEHIWINEMPDAPARCEACLGDGKIEYGHPNAPDAERIEICKECDGTGNAPPETVIDLDADAWQAIKTDMQLGPRFQEMYQAGGCFTDAVSNVRHWLMHPEEGVPAPPPLDVQPDAVLLELRGVGHAVVLCYRDGQQASAVYRAVQTKEEGR